MSSVLLPLVLLGLGASEASAAPVAGARLVLQPGHSKEIVFAGVSADGARVVTGGDDGTAIVWHAASGAGLQRLEGHDGRVSGAAFSPDRSRLVTFGDFRDYKAIVWDPERGTRLFELPHEDMTSGAAFTPDGARVAVAMGDGRAKLWDAATGQLVALLGDEKGESGAISGVSADGTRVFTQKPDRNGVTIWDTASGKVAAQVVDEDGVIYAVFSADGKKLFTTDREHHAKLWDAATGLLVKKVKAKPIMVRSASFSADGKWVVVVGKTPNAEVISTLSAKGVPLPAVTDNDRYHDAAFVGGNIVTANADRTMRIIDPATAKELRRFATPGEEYHQVNRLVVMPDGASVIGVDGEAAAWDLTDGHKIHDLAGHALGVRDAAWSPDGSRIASANLDPSATVWNLAQGSPERRLVGPDKPLWTLAWSADSAGLVTGAQFGVSVWWDVAAGGALQTVPDHEGPVYAVDVSPDGSRVASGGLDGAVHEWNTGSGTQVHDLKVDGSNAITVDYSADGKRLYTAYTNGSTGVLEVHDAETGAVTQRIGVGELVCAAFSADGKRVAAGLRDGKLDVYDVATSKVVYHAEGDSISSCAFSPDGQRVALGSWDGAGTLHNLAKKGAAARFEGHSGRIYSIEFAPDGRHVLTGSIDGTTRVWDAATGQEQLALMSFSDGRWAAVDPQGRFDASEDGRVDGLVWVIDGEPYALDQLREQFYEPGLVAKVLGGRAEPVRAVPALSSIGRPPTVKLDGQQGRLQIEVQDQGGGVGKVFVTLNGVDISERVAAACPALAAGGACAVDLSTFPTWKPGEENQLEAFASVADGAVRSRGTVREVQASGVASTDPPDLWVLAVGSGDYAGTEIDLRYAGLDALQFANAIRVAGDRGFGADRTHVKVLSTESRPGVEGRPSAEALAGVVSWMERADPGDTFVLFLSGHGVSVADDYFYVLPTAGGFGDLKDDAARAVNAWSGAQIAETLGKIAPLKRVVILDTCAAGALDVAALAAPRALSADAVRAHARVQERTGAWFLAGAAADQVSYEASRYGEGVLTYSLLEGMRGPALDEASLLYVSRLFAHAETQVPVYAKGIGGIQRPVIRTAEAGDFVLGQLATEDRAKVPLQQVKPVVVRARVVPAGGRADRLGVEGAINAALREAAAAESAPFVVWDSDGVDDTWQLTGTYAEKPGQLAFTGFLTRTTGGKVDERPLSASGADAAAVAKAVIEKVAATIAK